MLFGRRNVLRIMLAAALMAGCLMSFAAGGRRKTDNKPQPDSIAVIRDVLQEMGRPRKMNSSAYPVQLHVSGRLVRIQSDHNQILPIYNQNGVFYLAMHLSKGTNWLSGLPRGRYFINNRPVNIN